MLILLFLELDLSYIYLKPDIYIYIYILLPLLIFSSWLLKKALICIYQGAYFLMQLQFWHF